MKVTVLFFFFHHSDRKSPLHRVLDFVFHYPFLNAIHGGARAPWISLQSLHKVSGYEAARDTLLGTAASFYTVATPVATKISDLFITHAHI